MIDNAKCISRIMVEDREILNSFKNIHQYLCRLKKLNINFYFSVITNNGVEYKFIYVDDVNDINWSEAYDIFNEIVRDLKDIDPCKFNSVKFSSNIDGGAFAKIKLNGFKLNEKFIFDINRF